MTDAAREFGCARCWPGDADAAWHARRTLEHVADLVDESHFHVVVLACRACAQQFVSVFTERIDWSGGDDAQSWTLVPLAPEEVHALAAHPAEAALRALAPARRSLVHDAPTGLAPVTTWGRGVQVGWHD